MEIKVFEIVYFPEVIHEDIPNLPLKIKARIKKAMGFAKGDRQFPLLRTSVWLCQREWTELGKPLHYSWTGHRRIRVGDYRIVYKIDFQNRRVIIVLNKHRKDVYKAKRTGIT